MIACPHCHRAYDEILVVLDPLLEREHAICYGCHQQLTRSWVYRARLLWRRMMISLGFHRPRRRSADILIVEDY